jgi:hypothetical protein
MGTPSGETPGGETASDAGRTASADDLLRELPGAPLAYLEGALQNPALTPALILLMLKSRFVGAPLIQKICQNAEWLKTYEVKAAIVLHPKTPRAVAMNLVSFLWWHDLARVIDRSALAPPLRRAAERLLSVRVQELALGERITLARIASRGVMNVLRKEENPMVIRALLQNPRLVEMDALAIAGDTRTQGAVLRELAGDHRFSSRPSVQKAIAKNPETPPAVALHLVHGFSTKLLKELAGDQRTSALVRTAAERLIEARAAARDAKD